MGIRFTCHHCSYAMHVKDFQSGKRGKCPHCSKSFRIPLESTDYSIPILDGQSESIANAPARNAIVVNKKKTVDTGSDITKTSMVAEQRKRAVSPSQSNSHAPATSTTKVRDTNQPANANGADKSIRPSLPRAFADAPNAAWYVRPPSGGQYGPADEQTLQVWIRENRVTHDSLLWREGQPQWIPSSTLLPELYQNESVSQAEDPVNEPITHEPTIATASGSFTLTRPVPTSASSAVQLTAQRKTRKRKQQWIAISILAIVSLCLCTGLVFVLFRK